MRTILAIIFFALINFFFTFPAYSKETIPQETIEARITSIIKKNGNIQTLTLEVTKGSNIGETITIDNSTIETGKKNSYKNGEKLLIIKTKDATGKDFYYIGDKVRREALFFLFGIFVLLALAMGKKQGFLSLVGMSVSFLVIFTYILPQIVSGQNPVLVAIIGSIIIIPITFILSHGMNAKTVIAITSTICSLIITGILSYFFVLIASLSGTSAEETTFLIAQIGTSVNLQGILLAGIIIAALGVLDDVTIAQTSLIQELKRANERLNFLELLKRGMNVGRDHIASVINTLILVYTGASLPLLLLFTYSERSFLEVINYEIIAVEIVKMLVGSIGLIMAVPITTLIASYYFQEVKKK